MDKKNQKKIFFGVACALFLSAMEMTSVGPAAPAILRELGGLREYPWLFTSYLLASAVTMPLWGHLSDRHGRKKLFIASLLLFLIGCTFCGLANNMLQLTLARAFKGIGAGGIVPLAFTILADTFDLQTRARMQGYLSAIWGISSVMGPFVGGSLSDTVGWRWIFLGNLFPGIFAIFFLYKNYHEKKRSSPETPLSFKSIISASVCVITFLLLLETLRMASSFVVMALLIISLLSFILFIFYERKATTPLIPHVLYKSRIFTMGCLSGFFISGMVIGLSSYSPLLFQPILGYGATASGLLLTPFSLSWVFFSILSTRLMLLRDGKHLLIFGSLLTFMGWMLMMIGFQNLTTPSIIFCMFLMGAGMAFNYPIVLISTQHGVDKKHVGFATAGLTWIRTLGSTTGTALMGIVLTFKLRYEISNLTPPLDTLTESLKQNPDLVFLPDTFRHMTLNPQLQSALHDSLFWVMSIAVVQTAMGLALAFFFPALPPQQPQENFKLTS